MMKVERLKNSIIYIRVDKQVIVHYVYVCDNSKISSCKTTWNSEP